MFTTLVWLSTVVAAYIEALRPAVLLVAVVLAGAAIEMFAWWWDARS